MPRRASTKPTKAVAPPTNGNEPTSIRELKPGQLVALGEVSINPRSLFGAWAAAARAYNPADDLVGRKGLEIYDQMRHDDAVKPAMALKKGAVQSTGWQIRPASEKQVDKQIADEVKWILTHMESLYGSFDDHVYELLSACDYGFACGELVLRVIEEGDYKGKVGLRTIKVRRPHDFIFGVDKHDNLLRLGQTYLTGALPLEKFLLYSYQREFGNWQGLSDLRAAYPAWWMKDNLWRWAGIYAERYAIPIPLGTHPMGVQHKAEVDKFRAMLTNFMAGTSLAMPEGFKVDLKEAGGTGVIIFEKLLQQCDLKISRSILIPNRLGLSAEPATGSYSQARKHFDIFLLVVDDLRRDTAEDVINNQLVRRLVDWNHANVTDYPTFEWLPFTSEDEANLLQAWLNAVTGQAVKPTYEDEVHIRAVTGFPEREETAADKAAAEEAAKAPEEQAPPEQGGGGGADWGAGGDWWSQGGATEGGGTAQFAHAYAEPFDPTLHPRGPKGAPTGGQFVAKPKVPEELLRNFGWTAQPAGDAQVFTSPDPAAHGQRVTLAADGSWVWHQRDDSGQWEEVDSGKNLKGLRSSLESIHGPSVPDARDSFSAINEYVENTYGGVNSLLRGTGRWRGEALADLKSTAQAMAYGFENPKVYKTAAADMAAYRGIDDVRVARKMRRLRPGQLIADPAFISTSFRRAIAEHASSSDEGGVMLTIRVPKGTRYLTGRSDEKEGIFQHHTLLRVVRVDKSDDPSWGPVEVECQLVHRKGKPYERVTLVALAPPYEDWADEDVEREVELGKGAAQTFAAWEESEHPRKGEGSPEGGQFAPKGEEVVSKEKSGPQRRPAASLSPDEREAQRQLIEDMIVTRREQKRPVPQGWLDRLDEIRRVTSGDDTLPAGKTVASLPVFGHPEATNLRPDKYGNLIPIRVSDVNAVQKFLDRTQQAIDELQAKLGRAEAITRRHIKVSPKDKRIAEDYLRSANGIEDRTILDMLRTETLPELSRIAKQFELIAAHEGSTGERPYVWEEGKHPRGGKGTPKGGEFVPKGTTLGPDASDAEIASAANRMGLSPEGLQKALSDTTRIARALSLKGERRDEPGLARPGEDTHGRCYDFAARFVMDTNRKNVVLVHGVITPPLGPLEGRTIGHGWVEVGTDEIFDPVIQKFYPRADYEAAFQATAERRYTQEAALTQMLRRKTYGPWHATAGEVGPPRRRKRD